MRIGRKFKWLLVLFVVAAAAGFSAVRAYWGDVTNEAATLMEALELKPGMTAADVGAGDGKMTVILAQRLGPSGRMYSTELEPEELRAATAGFANVAVIQAGEQQTNLPAECCDAIVMRMVYHHITNPAAMNASLFQALRPGGRLAVIDFSPRFWAFWLPRPGGVPEDRGGHGMPPAALVEELGRAGFRLERRIDDWPKLNYCVIVRKPV